MTSPSDYPYPSLKSKMRIELFTSDAKREAGIIMDRPFGQKMSHIELVEVEKRLHFIFEGDVWGHAVWDLGNPLHDLTISILKDHSSLGLVQIDLETKQPLSTFQVPLKVI